MGIGELLDRWNENIDPRTKDLPLVSSNYLVPSIIFAYLYFVLKCGPEYMKDRQPYNLKTFIKFYNIAQVIINGYLIGRFIAIGTYNELKLCYPTDFSFDPIDVEVAYTLWLVFMSRFLDLAETVVFVLRKKNRQVSFLHVFHHVVVLTTMGWYAARFYAVRLCVAPTILNCAVHTIMYSYYFFSSLDKPPKIVQTMKPYITIMQLVQFVMMLMYAAVTYFASCPVLKGAANINFIIVMVFFKLFYDFYQENYTTKKEHKN